MIMTDIHKKHNLKRLRASLRLTQKMLAAAAHISEPTLLDIEKGRTRPHMVTAYAIVDALNSFLRAQGKQEVTIDDIDWTIR